MMPSLRRSLPLLALLCTLPATAAISNRDVAAFEQHLRKQFLIAADYRFVYHDAQGRTVAGNAVVQPRGSDYSYDIRKDHANKRVIVSLDTTPTKAEAAPTLPVGNRLPDLLLKPLQGAPLNLGRPRPQPTLLSFYFADCAPCVHEVPTLNRFAQQGHNLALAAVTFDDAATAGAFVKRHGLRWPVYPAADALLKAVGVQSYPAFAVVGRDGRLLGYTSGGRLQSDGQLDTAKLERWVDQLLRR